MDFRKQLECLINGLSMENGSDTPDFVLAEYLHGCLENFDRAVTHREEWYGRDTKRGPAELMASCGSCGQDLPDGGDKCDACAMPWYCDCGKQKPAHSRMCEACVVYEGNREDAASPGGLGPDEEHY